MTETFPNPATDQPPGGPPPGGQPVDPDAIPVVDMFGAQTNESIGPEQPEHRDPADASTPIAVGAEHSESTDPVPVPLDAPVSVLETAKSYEYGYQPEQYTKEADNIVRGLRARARLDNLEAKGRVTRVASDETTDQAQQRRQQTSAEARSKAVDEGRVLNSELGEAAPYAAAAAKESRVNLSWSEKNRKREPYEEASRETAAGSTEAEKKRETAEFYHERNKARINEARQEALGLFQRDPERYQAQSVPQFIETLKHFQGEMKKLFTFEDIGEHATKGLELLKAIDLDAPDITSDQIRKELIETFFELFDYQNRVADQVSLAPDKQIYREFAKPVIGILMNGEPIVSDEANYKGPNIDRIMGFNAHSLWKAALGHLSENPDLTPRNVAKELKQRMTTAAKLLQVQAQKQRQAIDRTFGTEKPPLPASEEEQQTEQEFLDLASASMM